MIGQKNIALIALVVTLGAVGAAAVPCMVAGPAESAGSDWVQDAGAVDACGSGILVDYELYGSGCDRQTVCAGDYRASEVDEYLLRPMYEWDVSRTTSALVEDEEILELVEMEVSDLLECFEDTATTARLPTVDVHREEDFTGIAGIRTWDLAAASAFPADYGAVAGFQGPFDLRYHPELSRAPTVSGETAVVMHFESHACFEDMMS